MSGEHGHDGRLVHELEMGEVDAVLEHVLRMHFQPRPVHGGDRVVVGEAAAVAESGEHVGDVEVGLASLHVVPDVDRLVALGHRIGADAPAPVGPVLVGDADVAALVVPLPAVKRTLDDLALDVTPETQVCAQVLAVGVHHGHPARMRPPRHHLLTEVRHPVDLADSDLGGPRDLEPSRRFHRQRRSRHPVPSPQEPESQWVLRKFLKRVSLKKSTMG